MSGAALNTPVEPAGMVIFDVFLFGRDSGMRMIILRFGGGPSQESTKDLTEKEFMAAMLSSIPTEEVLDLCKFLAHLSDGWEDAPEWAHGGDVHINLGGDDDNSKKWAAFRDEYVARLRPK
jgi:hypothetical protein